MSPELIGGLAFVVAILILSLGLHIGLVLGFIGVTGVWLILGDFQSLIGLLKSTPYASVGVYDLSVVPLFILMGEFAYTGGISSQAFDALNRLIGKVRGGLAIATTWGCVAFGATSGSSVATASVFTKAAYPEMVKAGYDKYFATGVIAVASTLDMLIPPSLYMVIFGILARTSIAQLLIAGLLPGIMMAAALTLSIYIRARTVPKMAPPAKADYSWKERGLYTLKAWPLALLAFIIIGGIYSGVMTPTESAAVGSFAAMIITLGFRRLHWTNFKNAMAEAAFTSAMLSFVVIGATLFSRLMTISGLPVWMGTTISQLGLSSIWVITIMLVIYGVLGCFIDAMSIMFITTPIFAPILVGLGVNLIWFGVLNCVILNLGMITPPFGLAAFTVKAAAGPDVKVEGVFKGTFFMYWAFIGTLILLIIFPQISTVLPNLMVASK